MVAFLIGFVVVWLFLLIFDIDDVPDGIGTLLLVLFGMMALAAMAVVGWALIALK